MDLEPILSQNNQALDTREAELRGRLEMLKEELLKIQAKKEHNKDLLDYMRQQQQNVPNNPQTIPDSEK